MSEDNQEIAISVNKVYKDFVLPHEKVTSVKKVFTHLFNSRVFKDTETQHALKDISFEVKKGEFFGIVGRNGSGKSTLLKIIAGIYQPTKGDINVDGKLVPFIELGVGFNAELTGRENVYLNGAMLGFSRKEIEGRYDEIVEFAELGRFMDQKLKNYSSGMQVRLAFSLATRAKADILLVDEVLAVGDADFQRKCFAYFKQLKAHNKTVVFVTHDMSAVREYCDRAMLIDKSEIQAMGNAQEIARDYAMLFMGKASEHAKKGDGKRFGNGDVYISDTKISVTEKEIIVSVEANVERPVDKVVYGIHIMGEDGAEITAMNNRMIHVKDVMGLKAGQKVTFTWNIENIFNDGTYFVMLTLIDDVSNTLDWYVNADNFTVRRTDRSTTAVLPPVSVTYKTSEGEN
jgi:ABC-2 type transport system ATP-binding protein